MALITVCVVAVLLPAAYAQTTQHMVYAPNWCLRTVAQESTGEVWAEMWLCGWNTEFHISAPNASDGTIRTDQDLCLIGGSEGTFFSKCEGGPPLQNWECVRTGITVEKLVAAGCPNSVPGQIVLASEDANTNRPKMCLKGTWVGAEGTRVTVVPCSGVEASYSTWMYAPPPPQNKVLLFMPARHAAGETACVQVLTSQAVQLGDCGDEDLVANWWVRDADLIRLAAGGWCLWADGMLVFTYDCIPDDDEQRWSLGEDGSLKVTMHPEYGCLTYVGEVNYPLQTKPCTGGSTQNFAFLPAAPAADAVQVV